MKIFLSWSGERSRMIAEALRRWLPDVLNFLEPWISSEDKDRGARWGSDLAQQLESTEIGIVCLTPENITAPWILFEAGALSKALASSRVCVYLFELRPSDLAGPLVQFQATEATENDTLKLLNTLNKLLGNAARSEEQLQRSFAKWWPELRNSMLNIPRVQSDRKPLRSDREILEEVLDLVRLETRRSAVDLVREDWLPLLASLEGEDVRSFAVKVASVPDATDENDVDWVEVDKLITETSVFDGTWASRWNGGSARRGSWRTGTATLIGRDSFLIAVYNEHGSPGYPFLIVARRGWKGMFLGRYVNLRAIMDSGPWIGRVVDNSRIDGYWSQGRWDFQRLHEGGRA